MWAWLSLFTVPVAFHEMCRDEYVMLMTWKKAAAGEIIYNKCPPNASGEGWVALPSGPHFTILAAPFWAASLGSLILYPEVWNEVGKCSAPTPNPLSWSLQGLPAAAVSSVPRVWHTGGCLALPAVSPMSTATCICQ